MKRFVLILLMVVLGSSVLKAEPWISNRMAQNCAGCHSPGRYNKVAKGRRCTLSCRGCHTNPNGGGIRNAYGKWNQNRWLKSFNWSPGHSKQVAIKPTGHQKPKPLSGQSYSSKTDVLVGSQNDKVVKGEETLENRVFKVPELKVTSSFSHNEEDYDKYNDQNWMKTVDSLTEFLSVIPREDPYYQERLVPVDGGGDFRYLYGRIKSDTDNTDTGVRTRRDADLEFLMAVDFGVRVKPIPDHLTLVAEARFSNAPGNFLLEHGVTSLSQIRTAYALVDNLAYNTWVMGGLYRPMFGHYTGDHETLSSDVSGFTQFSVNKAIGIGGSPNVPFYNVHAILPMTEQTVSSFKNNRSFNGERGFAASAGLRFVTLGFSSALSYWSTKSDLTRKQRTLLSWYGGAHFFKRLVYNYEFLRSRVENLDSGQQDTGSVVTQEFKYRFWREMYLTTSYAFSNVTRSLNQGSANEASLGAKFMIFGGLEVDVAYIIRNEKQTADVAKGLEPQKTKTNQAHAQIHMYF